MMNMPLYLFYYPSTLLCIFFTNLKEISSFNINSFESSYSMNISDSHERSGICLKVNFVDDYNVLRF